MQGVCVQEGHPFFEPFTNRTILGENGSQEAMKPAVRASILGGGVPALSNAAGGPSGREMNIETVDFISFIGDEWPRDEIEWLHSDLREIAYVYNYRLYDDMVNRGSLK